LSCLSDVSKALHITHKLWVGFRKLGENRMTKCVSPGSGPVGKAVENPSPFAKAVQKIGVAQKLQMPGNAWLALAKYVCDFGDRQLTLRANSQNAQTGGFRRSF
jgi:hypothetical protein